MKIFIIHGWTYNLDLWVEFCEKLKNHGIEPIQLRVPGLTMPSDKVWTIDDYVEWLHKELASEIHPVVLGHSNGGRIALAYSQKYPKHIKQLFLIDSAGIPKERIASRLKVRGLKTASKVKHVIGLVPGIKKGFYKVIGAQDYYNAPENMKRTMQYMLNADNGIDLSRIEMPTVIIWGSNDKSTPLADGKKMHARIKGSTLNIIKGARHAPFSTHAEDVVKIIDQEILR
jgi:pimeloyl-ACP methyl ester carboxylesterase